MLEQRISQNFLDLNIKFRSKYTANYEINMRIFGVTRSLELLNYLKNDPELYCQQLTDLLVIDYLDYGKKGSDPINLITTEFNSVSNYSEQNQNPINHNLQFRFGVVYQLLSLTNNLRIIVEFLLINDNLMIPSCTDLWPSSNWYEREAFDLFGINFTNHPNLHRILNEKNFEGYPFRKDFPISGYVEARFDNKQQKIIYESRDLEPYSVVPKIIRDQSLQSYDE